MHPKMLEMLVVQEELVVPVEVEALVVVLVVVPEEESLKYQILSEESTEVLEQ
jgi:hypothetical protein